MNFQFIPYSKGWWKSKIAQQMWQCGDMMGNLSVGLFLDLEMWMDVKNHICVSVNRHTDKYCHCQ